MKIYKLLFLLFVTTTLTLSQSLDGIKICVDPGHGGNDPANDRHMIEADFWESAGNFYKALHADEILKSLGATVILTRFGNSNSDEIALSVRAGIANSNNVDLFHSIHSNATGTSNRVNFSLMLYRGYTDAPVFPAAKTYAAKLYRNFEKVNHVTDKTWDVIYGDWTFYPSWGTSGLGVLRSLTMPGVLSEGSFHDYIPEAWRLKNDGYLRHEAWAITRAILEHFGACTLQNGNVAGVLRDPFSNVPSSYQPISELGDNKKPVNHVKATLQPGNFVYNGDDQNNGYFFFDEITPGDYTLYIEAEDYSIDSIDITVAANKSLFVNRNLSLIPNENNPNVVESVPANNEEGFSNAANIEVQFDIRMDKTSTEDAFSITPTVTGTFSWEDNQKRLIFNPASNLTAGESYQVSISNSAQTIFDKNLLFGYNFQFSTRSKLNLISAYPANGEVDISQSVQVKLLFDQAIKNTTLAGNISFEDSEGNFVSLAVDQATYSQGLISFVSTSRLVNGASYKVILGEGIGDIEGVTFQENVEIIFTVESEIYTEGELVDDFETTGNWDSPLENSFSNGLDINSSFSISMSKRYDGFYAGKINYSFNKVEGYYKISRVNPVSVGNNGESIFGLWIWGDLSFNIIEYWFTDSESNYYSIEVDTLDFTGWKMKSVKLTDVASGELKFEGFGIKHNSSADSSGLFYIDNAQYDFTTPVKEPKHELPTEYSLSQNYPNPFNPSTTIKYSIPFVQTPLLGGVGGGLVTLKVYDILGREVATLVNKNQKAGNYEVKFSATGGLTSGIYFYRLQANEFSESRKMLLLK
ncbi:MAG: Ig-like domain-containing protein [Melioribacteraceae bacterium]|nr:Ig-like domain-containing protein [Melioribacteraceae bacterium]